MYAGVGFNQNAVDTAGTPFTSNTAVVSGAWSSIRVNGSNCPAPAKDQAVIWSNTNMLGSCQVVGTSRIANIGARFPGWDASMSSVQVGVDSRFSLFDGTNFQGWSSGVPEYHLRSDHAFFPALGVNDMASSMVVSPRTNCGGANPPAGTVAVYEEINYRGACRILPIGNYRHTMHTELDVKNDAISSIAFGSGISVVTMYEHEENEGASRSITGSTPNLHLIARPPKAGDTWGDEVSSLQVQ